MPGDCQAGCRATLDTRPGDQQVSRRHGASAVDGCDGPGACGTSPASPRPFDVLENAVVSPRCSVPYATLHRYVTGCQPWFYTALGTRPNMSGDARPPLPPCDPPSPRTNPLQAACPQPLQAARFATRFRTPTLTPKNQAFASATAVTRYRAKPDQDQKPEKPRFQDTHARTHFRKNESPDLTPLNPPSE